MAARMQETLYRWIMEEQWAALLDFVYRNRTAVAEDPLLVRAVETFLEAFFARLEQEGPAGAGEVLERLFLLHTGRMYRLPSSRFEQVCVHLVTLHADRPEAARGYARHCPDHPRCAAVLAGPDGAPEPVPHAQEALLSLAANRPAAAADHTISLFKSQQEVDFFMAVREVFATYLVYPNVALRCLVDYEALRAQLTAEERRYFFHGLVDCVVFDQHDGYRPRYCFELDSALHDTEARQAKDRHKEHILALAGQRLHRIRKRTPEAGREAFTLLLREVAGRG